MIPTKECLDCEREYEFDPHDLHARYGSRCPDCDEIHAVNYEPEVKEPPEFFSDGTTEDEIIDAWEIQKRLK